MASIKESFFDALNEDFSILKIAIYSVPVNICANLFLSGKMSEFYFFSFLTVVLLLGLLTQGINNVRMNRREILTLNAKSLLISLLKTFVAVVPQVLFWGFVSYWIISNISIPIDYPQVPLIFNIVVISIAFSFVLTSYMSFAKYLDIKQAFNYKVILDSCIDVLISFIFFIPQLLIANVILVGPVAYLFYLFKLPFTHWGFVLFASLASIVNISIMANYLAQASYEQIKGNNEDYDEHVQINIIDDVTERMNNDKNF